MIEEFIQRLQQTEDKADAIVAAAREKVQTIDHDLDSSLVQLRASVARSLQERFAEIDVQACEQLEAERSHLRGELVERLQELEHETQKRRDEVQTTLLKRLL